jgi:anti-sigma factor RsiW
MSCSPFDLRDYFLKELTDPQQRQVEDHVTTCSSCFEEMEQLRLTEAALFSLRDEELPQRIAFVSDKIFEPSPVRRWWTAFWASGARLGFAGAAMLSVAILVSAMTRPAPAPERVIVERTVVQPVSDTEMKTRVDAAVAQAMAGVEQRHAAETRQIKTDLEDARRRLLLAAEYSERKDKRTQTARVGLYDLPEDK